jgi:hypothetical protein
MTEHDLYYEIQDKLAELTSHLNDIIKSQWETDPAKDTRRLIAGIEATYDKHDAINLILDYCGPEIERLFEEIR